MNLNSETIADAAQRIGIKPDELAAVVRHGQGVKYQAADYLFHESMPRQFCGQRYSRMVQALNKPTSLCGVRLRSKLKPLHGYQESAQG